MLWERPGHWLTGDGGLAEILLQSHAAAMLPMCIHSRQQRKANVLWLRPLLAEPAGCRCHRQGCAASGPPRFTQATQVGP